MIILKCSFKNQKVIDGLFEKKLIKKDQTVFNNIDDNDFFNFIFYKVEDSLPIFKDSFYSSKLNIEEYKDIFDSFNLGQDELLNQTNYLDAYTFSDDKYITDMTEEYLEDIELEASIGAVECFPKFTKFGVVWDVSSEDWDEKEYRVYSGLTYSKLSDFNLTQLLELIIFENINDEILTENDILEWYPDWEDDRESVIDEIWDELKSINRNETKLGSLI